MGKQLISDVMIESGLIDHLIKLNLLENIVTKTKKPFNKNNLKSMRILKKTSAVVKPNIHTDFLSVRNQRIIVDGYPLFIKVDLPHALETYLWMLEAEDVDTFVVSYDKFVEKLPFPSGPKRKSNSA